MLESMQERKKHIQGLSDSELKEYFNDLCECNKEQDKEIEEIRRNFCRLNLRTPRHIIESNLSTIEMNNFLIAIIREELESRKSNNVLLSISTLEVFNSEDNESSVTSPKIGNVRILTVEQEAGSGATIQAFHEVNSSDLDKEIKKIKKRYGK